MGDGFVFAALTGENEEEGVAFAAQNAFGDDAQGMDLVWPQGHSYNILRKKGDVTQ
jgi:hypothetical protein